MSNYNQHMPPNSSSHAAAVRTGRPSSPLALTQRSAPPPAPTLNPSTITQQGAIESGAPRRSAGLRLQGVQGAGLTGEELTVVLARRRQDAHFGHPCVARYHEAERARQCERARCKRRALPLWRIRRPHLCEGGADGLTGSPPASAPKWFCCAAAGEKLREAQYGKYRHSH